MNTKKIAELFQVDPALVQAVADQKAAEDKRRIATEKEILDAMLAAQAEIDNPSPKPIQFREFT